MPLSAKMNVDSSCNNFFLGSALSSESVSPAPSVDETGWDSDQHVNKKSRIVSVCRNCSMTFRVGCKSFGEFCSKDCHTTYTIFGKHHSLKTPEKSPSEIRNAIYQFQKKLDEEVETHTPIESPKAVPKISDKSPDTPVKKSNSSIFGSIFSPSTRQQNRSQLSLFWKQSQSYHPFQCVAVPVLAVVLTLIGQSHSCAIINIILFVPSAVLKLPLCSLFSFWSFVEARRLVPHFCICHNYWFLICFCLLIGHSFAVPSPVGGLRLRSWTLPFLQWKIYTYLCIVPNSICNFSDSTYAEYLFLCVFSFLYIKHIVPRIADLCLCEKGLHAKEEQSPILSNFRDLFLLFLWETNKQKLEKRMRNTYYWHDLSSYIHIP